jgi:hypothetical protein
MKLRSILKKRRKPIIWGCVAAALAALLIFLHIDGTAVSVNSHEIHLPHLAPADDNMRVMIVSDTHFHSGDAGRAARLADMVNRENPDLILLLGDFINGSPDPRGSLSMEDLTRFVSRLRARCGIFAVTGNHELWYGRDKVVSALHDAGVEVLLNRAVTIGTPSGGKLQIVSISDYTTQEPPENFPEIDAELPTLVMMHDPNGARFVPAELGCFIVAGHTHGGELRLIPNGSDRTSLRLIMSRIKNKLGQLPAYQRPYALFDQGFSDYRGRKIFITRGVGTSRLGVRIFCPPEIVLLKLRSDPGAVKNTYVIPEEL